MIKLIGPKDCGSCHVAKMALDAAGTEYKYIPLEGEAFPIVLDEDDEVIGDFYWLAEKYQIYV